MSTMVGVEVDQNQYQPAEKARSSDASKRIKAEVRLISSATKYEVEFVRTTTAGQLIDALLIKLNLSQRDSFGQLNLWELHTKDRVLLREDLLEPYVCESETLILYLVPQVCAG